MTEDSNRDEFIAMFDGSNALEYLKIDIRESIIEITINAPPHNSFTMQSLEEMSLLCKLVILAGEANKFAARGVIITGAGRAFSAGMSIDMLNELTEKEDQERVRRIGRDLMAMIENSRVPVIAAISGICLGAGLELALACHYRVCGRHVHLGFPEIKLDLMPGASGTQALPKLIGRSKALYLLLSGKLVTAEDALRIGLVDMVVDRKSVMVAARAIAKDICFMNEKATEFILEATAAGLYGSIEEGRMLEERFFWELVTDRQSRKRFPSREAVANAKKERKPERKRLID